MNDEYNQINLSNDDLPKNEIGFNAVINDYVVADAVVAELPDSETHTSGKLTKTTSKISITTSMVTMVAAVTVTVTAVAAAASDPVVEEPVIEEPAITEVLPPSSQVYDVNVSLYAYGSDVSVVFLLDGLDELESYNAWLEDVGGNIAECTLEYDGEYYTATADVTGIDAEGGITFVVQATAANGWTGELYRGEVTLPSAPDYEIVDISNDGSYSVTDGGVAYINLIYESASSNVVYEYHIEDMDGNRIECSVRDEGEDYLDLYASVESGTELSLDVFGQAYLVVTAATSDGWQGEVAREKFVMAYYGYTSKPYVYDVTCDYFESDYNIEFFVDVYNLNEVWSGLIFTFTGADGTLYTVDLYSDDASYDGGFYIYYTIPDDFALFEDGTVLVTVTATWQVPDGNGGYLEEYQTVEYDYYIEVTNWG
ncbi:MAG: hypothetical protein LUI60_04255 [Clostridia bacterium]|nr:hypothetical protein [Clostridia bacterium]